MSVCAVHMWRRLLLSFSVPRNVSKLTHVAPTEPFLDMMHSYRTFFMAVIVLGHRLLTLVGHPIYNGEDFEQASGVPRPLLSGPPLCVTLRCSVPQLTTSPGNMIVVNGPVLVDIFLAFGGVVLAYFFVLELRKSTSVRVLLLAVVNRYLRSVRGRPFLSNLAVAYSASLSLRKEGDIKESR